MSCPQYDLARRTRSLHLNDRDLVEIPKPVWSLTNLIRLDLSFNYLTALPSDIQSLLNIENLWLNGNPLDSLPSEIENCRKLKVLDLRQTQISTIPREVGRLKNLFLLDLRDTPLCGELSPFRGSTSELVSYLFNKDRRTTLCNGLTADLLATKYLETADMSEGSVVVRAIVSAVAELFQDYDELTNVARNAERLFPVRYASPVDLRAAFATADAKQFETKEDRARRWEGIAQHLAKREAAKIKKSYIKLQRENEMVKLSADMELKISAIYYDNHDPTDIEGWLRSIYDQYTPQTYESEGRTDCPDLEDIRFVIQHAIEIFPPSSTSITGVLIRRSMLDLQKRLTLDREKCVKGIITALSAMYADRHPKEVEDVARAVAKNFERDRFANERELEELKKVSADAAQLFPAEFAAVDVKAIKRLFRERELAAAKMTGA